MTKRSMPWRLVNAKGEFACTHWEGHPCGDLLPHEGGRAGAWPIWSAGALGATSP
jgi:hypothetical protein